eukprot:Colp12_sorted_trinity150504_noHs@2242
MTTPDVLDTLREADAVVNKGILDAGLTTALSQVPVIIFPVHFDRSSGEPSTKRSIAIRTFITSDFMTGVPAVPDKQIPSDVLNRMVAGVQAVPGVSRVVYDLTAKPPGTTEWE